MNYSQFNQSPFNKNTHLSCSLLGLNVVSLGLLSSSNNFSESVALLGLNQYCADNFPTLEPIPTGTRR